MQIWTAPPRISRAMLLPGEGQNVHCKMPPLPLPLLVQVGSRKREHFTMEQEFCSIEKCPHCFFPSSCECEGGHLTMEQGAFSTERYSRSSVPYLCDHGENQGKRFTMEQQTSHAVPTRKACQPKLTAGWACGAAGGLKLLRPNPSSTSRSVPKVRCIWDSILWSEPDSRSADLYLDVVFPPACKGRLECLF